MNISFHVGALRACRDPSTHHASVVCDDEAATVPGPTVSMPTTATFRPLAGMKLVPTGWLQKLNAGKEHFSMTAGKLCTPALEQRIFTEYPLRADLLCRPGTEWGTRPPMRFRSSKAEQQTSKQMKNTVWNRNRCYGSPATPYWLSKENCQRITFFFFWQAHDCSKLASIFWFTSYLYDAFLYAFSYLVLIRNTLFSPCH